MGVGLVATADGCLVCACSRAADDLRRVSGGEPPQSGAVYVPHAVSRVRCWFVQALGAMAVHKMPDPFVPLVQRVERFITDCVLARKRKKQ